MTDVVSRLARPVAAAIVLTVVCAGAARAESPAKTAPSTVAPAPELTAPLLVVPQSRVFAVDGTRPAVRVTDLALDLKIGEETATARLTTTIVGSGRDESAQLLVPVPRGAKLRGVTVDGASAPVVALVRRGSRAAALWEAAALRVRSLAPLEFGASTVVRTAPIAIPKGATIRVVTEAEFPVETHDGRLDLVFPRGSDPADGVTWKMSVALKTSRPVATVFSPTHDVEQVETETKGETGVEVRDPQTPGPFRLSALFGGPEPVATFFTYPAPDTDGGTFLMVGAMPLEPAADSEDAAKRQREVLFVIDRSGSMAGQKIEQARRAIMTELRRMKGEVSFDVIDFATEVGSLSDAPMARTDDSLARVQGYLNGLPAADGTNLNDGLVRALGRPIGAARSEVILLTDGAPSVGEVRPNAIVANVRAANVHNRPVYTIGVGFDVNRGLLEDISAATGGTATSIDDADELERRAGEAFARIGSRSLGDARVSANEGALADLEPATLGDLHFGERFTVGGRYHGAAPIRVSLVGNADSGKASYEFVLDPSKGTGADAFVARAWASRRVASLVASVARRPNTLPAKPVPGAPDALAPLAAEIVRLSLDNGVRSEIAPFVGDGVSNLADEGDLQRSVRSGLEGVAKFGRQAIYRGGPQEPARIRYVRETTLVKRGDDWVDLRLLRRGGGTPDVILDGTSADVGDQARELVRQRRSGVFGFTSATVLVRGKIVRVTTAAARTVRAEARQSR